MNGCPFCGRESLQKTQALTLQEFIQKAREIHGNKYDYSKANTIKLIEIKYDENVVECLGNKLR